jgi:hypothetical protein
MQAQLRKIGPEGFRFCCLGTQVLCPAVLEHSWDRIQAPAPPDVGGPSVFIASHCSASTVLLGHAACSTAAPCRE